MEDIKKVIAKNLIYFRTRAKYTQFELAQKLNYSDKSISKWERGAGVPDVITLKQLADLYEIKVDDFFTETEFSTAPAPENHTKTFSKVFVTLLSVGLIWFLASIVFVVLLWLKVPRAYLSFITAIPVSMIVLIVLTRIWFKLYIVGIFASLSIWTIALTIYLFTINTHSYYLFFICIPLQVLVVLWFVFRDKLIKNKNNNSNIE